MHVVAFNGSPREKGNTFHALNTVAEELRGAGVTVEIVHVGHLALRGCMGCNTCARRRDGSCILPDDGVNEAIGRILRSDGVLLGAPTYFGDVPGTMKCFLDRVFYAGDYNADGAFQGKVGAAVAVVRRPGGRTTLDCLLRYLNVGQMLLPGSNGWPIVYGLRPGEVLRDEEGMQSLRSLGRNMAWTLRLLDQGRDIPLPPRERKRYLNLIR